MKMGGTQEGGDGCLQIFNHLPYTKRITLCFWDFLLPKEEKDYKQMDSCKF